MNSNENTSEDFLSNKETNEDGEIDSELQVDEEVENELKNSEEQSENLFNICSEVKCRKFPFKLVKNELGNILTVHHTRRRGHKIFRICLATCCFSESGTQFVVIDKKGYTFVFDLETKEFWRLVEVIPDVNVIRSYKSSKNIFLIGTKNGQIFKLDIDKSCIIQGAILSSEPIKEISFTGQTSEPRHLALIRTTNAATIIDVDAMYFTHCLKFKNDDISLKYACYLPLSDQIFTCFTNDTVQIWSAVTLQTVRIIYPLKLRDRKLKEIGGCQCVPVLALCPPTAGDEFSLACLDQDYSNGKITCYCYSRELNLLCLGTLDNYLLMFDRFTLELQKMFRLRDFSLKKIYFLPKEKECLILGITNKCRIVLLDCDNPETRLIIEPCRANNLFLPPGGKLFMVIMRSGEAKLWNTCRVYNTMRTQANCYAALKSAFSKDKPLNLPMSSTSTGPRDCKIPENIAQLLRRDKLLSILKEYGCFPSKYRALIWCSMLKLPGNRREFQQLLKLPIPQQIKQRAIGLKIKNETLKRCLIKIWSCLAHWCRVFAYSDFIPYLIFPFVKLYDKNPLSAFEICSTLLTNHFQFWFEFHPLQPANYLGMCENILQYFDPELSKYFIRLNVDPNDYAWPILSTAFSEVLDEEQWFCLWDNIISADLYYPIFVVVAYVLLQREVIIRLPDKDTVQYFFHEQNPADVSRILKKSVEIMYKCPLDIHPKKYFPKFEAIPKNVYPKFLKYPREWLEQHEKDINVLKKEQQFIDKRLRDLELQEYKIVERLEEGLKREEQSKRLKEMEKLYHDTLKREEERMASHRKVLALYQREIRNRKGEIIEKLSETEHRRRTNEMNRQLESLMNNIEMERMRNELDVTLAEDEVRNQHLNLLEQKYMDKIGHNFQSLDEKYKENIKSVIRERQRFQRDFQEITKDSGCRGITKNLSNLDAIERQLCDIQKQFYKLTKRK